MSIFPYEKIDELRAYPICYRLKRLRLWCDMSQRDFAKAIHCTQTSVSRWESGVKIPSDLELIKIIRYYELPDDFFLDAEIQQVKLAGKKKGTDRDD